MQIATLDISIDISSVCTKMAKESECWSIHKKQVTPVLVNPANAVSALGELTPGGALMKGFQEESLAREFILNLKFIKSIMNENLFLFKIYRAST